MSILDVVTGAAVTAARTGLVPTRAVDVVCILGPGFSPFWSPARPVEATVFEFADLMEHPVENGTVIADHLVQQPTEILIPLICVGEVQFRATYAAIRSTFKGAQKLTVMTRTGAYPDMVITDMPHEERPDAMNAIRILLRLREAVVVTPQSGEGEPADAADQSTKARGDQQTRAPNASQAAGAGGTYGGSGQGSTLYNLGKGVLF